jgi:hypothetical protein
MIGTRSRAFVGCALLSAACFFARAPIARAQDAAQLDAIYAAGKADIKAGNPAAALEKFRRGLVANPDPEHEWAMLIGAALACEGMGMPIVALDYLNRFTAGFDSQAARASDVWRARRAGVDDEVRQLEKAVLLTHGALTVASTPNGAHVTIDGTPYGSGDTLYTTHCFYLAPGRHEVTLEREGFSAVTVEFDVRAGNRDTVHVPLTAVEGRGALLVRTGAPEAVVALDGVTLGQGLEVSAGLPEGRHVLRVEREGFPAFQREVDVHLGTIEAVDVIWPPAATVVAPETPEPAPPAVTARASGLRPLWGWIAVGGGAAVALAGIPFTAMAIKARDDMQALVNDPSGVSDPDARFDSLNSRMKSNQVVAGVFYGLGGAAVLGGAAYLLFFARHAPGAEVAEPAAGVGWVPLPGGGVLTFGGRW